MGANKLNTEQSRAVDYTKGPLLILAGPGSGKTFTITEKVISLIEGGLSADRVLALTFSEKAAGEMQDRIEKKIGEQTGITVSTFHSFCNELIRDFSLQLGIGQNVKLISKEHSLVWGINNIDSFGFEYVVVPPQVSDLINSMLEGVSQFHDNLISPSQLKDYITDKYKDPGLDDDAIEELNFLEDLSVFYEHYQQYKYENNFVDFDDMIKIACDLLQDNESARRQVRARYDYILVDEFQDTNFAQLYLIYLISGGKDLTCVADDDQCIYRFRGAYLSNINQLEDYYNTLEKVALKLNYRSTSQIVDLSRQLIQHNPQRQEKDLVSHNGDGHKVKVVKTPDDLNEARWVADEISRLISDEGLEPEDVYILTRTRADGEKFNTALKKQMIPVEYVGSLKLVNFPVIQEALAYINIINDPFNSGVSFASVLSREGLSELNLQKINVMARQLSRKHKLIGDGIYSVLTGHLDKVPMGQKGLVRSFISRIEYMLSYKKNHLPSDTVKHLLLDKTDLYRSQTHEDTPGARKNISILNSLICLVEDLELIDGGCGFEQTLRYVGQVFDLDIPNDDTTGENTVKVMTIHQSKGKEARAVFVCDMATRHLPLNFMGKEFTVPPELEKGVKRIEDEHILHLEEERRLAYVAMTRAREKLYLVFPDIYQGNKRKAKPGRFLEDIDYLNNPLIEYLEPDATEVSDTNVPDSPIKVKKDEYQRLINMYTRQGQIKEAMEALIVLARLSEFETSGNQATFDPAPLLDLDTTQPADLEDLINNKTPPLIDPDMTFSASKIKQYMDCPLRFKYSSILQIPTPRKSYFQIGTGVHAVYEQLSKQKMQGHPIDLNLATTLLNENWDPSSFSSTTQEKQEHTKMQEMLQFWLARETDCKSKTICVEEPFDLILDGHHFKGFIDRIDETPSGEYEVIDYKTNKTPTPKKRLKEDVQLALYCLAVKEKYGKLPARAGHFYVHPKVAEMRVVDVSEESVGAVVERILEAVEGILSEDFEVKEKPNCYFCDYGGICEWVGR